MPVERTPPQKLRHGRDCNFERIKSITFNGVYLSCVRKLRQCNCPQKRKTSKMLWLRIATFLFCAVVVFAKDNWHKPGCHKVGNTRKISIPDCVEFWITTNACRGFCESYAVPSIPYGTTAGLIKPSKPVISIGQCCNIMESENVTRRVYCLDGIRTLTFKSAISCSCYHCKKD